VSLRCENFVLISLSKDIEPSTSPPSSEGYF